MQMLEENTGGAEGVALRERDTVVIVWCIWSGHVL